jgi:signal transduction histidine kinase
MAKDQYSEAVKIAVVDDNAVVRINVAHMLTAPGRTVIEARNGREALEIVRRERPNLVLLDVVLPDIHGVQLCQAIKSDPAASGTFVALFSETETSSEVQVSGLEAGADAYIARPIGNRELRARVEALLRIQRAEAALRHAQSELERRVQARTAELQRANEALRRLSLRLVEVQESERRFIARELHDEVGQVLTGLKISLELGGRKAPTDFQPLLADALRLIGELMDRVRQLSLDLRPQILDDLGLLIALDWHFKRYRKQTGIKIVFTHAPFGHRLPAAMETVVFRIVQESLTNVARHAGVREASVSLELEDRLVRVTVRDQGCGFDPEAVLCRRESNGLFGIKERAELLGGNFQIWSSPGAGTMIQVELPRKPSPAPLAKADSNRLDVAVSAAR